MDSTVIGRYSPFNTFVHKLDSRNKVFLMILLMVTIFLQFKVWSTNLIISGLLLICLIVIMLVSKVSIKSLLKSLRSIWILLLVLMLIYIFIPNSSYKLVCFYIGNYPIYWDSFYQCGYIMLRLVMMLIITMILTSTTKPMDLTYAFEWYMYPLKIIRFPVHEIAMTLSIALRFIPTILEETERIMKAQSSRGVDFQHGGFIKRVRAVISLIVPLLVSSFQRSEELANAMEARGYNPREKRTKYRLLKFGLIDLFAFLIIGLIFAGVLTLCIFDNNGFPINIIKFIFNAEVPF